MIARVLIKEPQKTGTRTNVRVGHAKIRTVKTAFGGIGGIVPRIAKPGDPELRDQRRLVEQRNFLTGNLKVGNTHLAEGVAKKHGRQRGNLIGQLHRTLVTLFGKGIDVARLFRESGGLKTEMGIAKGVGCGVSQQRAPLQRASAQLEGESARASG